MRSLCLLWYCLVLTTVPLSCLPSDPFLEGRTCAPPPSKNRRLSCITSDSHPLPSPLFSPLCVLLLRRPRSSSLHFSLSKPGCIYTRLVSLALLHSSLSLPLYIASGFEKAIWQEETGGELGLAVQSKLGQSKTLIGRVSSLLSPHVSPPFLLVTPLLVSNPTFGLLQDEFFPPGNSYPSLSQVLKHRRMLRNRG